MSQLQNNKQFRNNNETYQISYSITDSKGVTVDTISYQLHYDKQFKDNDGVYLASQTDINSIDIAIKAIPDQL